MPQCIPFQVEWSVLHSFIRMSKYMKSSTLVFRAVAGIKFTSRTFESVAEFKRLQAVALFSSANKQPKLPLPNFRKAIWNLHRPHTLHPCPRLRPLATPYHGVEMSSFDWGTEEQPADQHFQRSQWEFSSAGSIEENGSFRLKQKIEKPCANSILLYHINNERWQIKVSCNAGKSAGNKTSDEEMQ